MGKKFDYELIVLGSGAAGSSAALFAAKSGVKVALIENNKWGGSALNYSDVPARALFEFSHLYHESQRGSRFGISSSTLRYNYPTVQNWKLLASRRVGANSKKPFEDAKITCLSGFASFLSPYEIALKAGFKPHIAPKVVPLDSSPEKLSINIAFVIGPDNEQVEFFKEV